SVIRLRGPGRIRASLSRNSCGRSPAQETDILPPRGSVRFLTAKAYRRAGSMSSRAAPGLIEGPAPVAWSARIGHQSLRLDRGDGTCLVIVGTVAGDADCADHGVALSDQHPARHRHE